MLGAQGFCAPPPDFDGAPLGAQGFCTVVGFWPLVGAQGLEGAQGFVAEANIIWPGIFAAMADGIIGAIEAVTAKRDSIRLLGFM